MDDERGLPSVLLLLMFIYKQIECMLYNVVKLSSLGENIQMPFLVSHLTKLVLFVVFINL